MSADLVERLRAWIATRDHPMNLHGQQSLTVGNELATEAAAEIKRLRAEIERMREQERDRRYQDYGH